MKIKVIIAATAVVFSGGLLFAPSAQAADKKTDKTKEPEAKIVTVKPGDTLTSIAKKHDTTYVKLYNANDKIADPDAIDVGDKIKIPKKGEKLPNRFSEYTALAAPANQVAASQYAAAGYTPVYSQTYTPGSQPVYATDSSGNTYFKGYCTWYAKDRRPDLPNRLGNGGQWTANAAAQGFATGSKPRVGAIAETHGHVAYVESVNRDGTITISEMNGSAGFGKVGTRKVSAKNYSYIYK